jgi:hypothetical protein
MASGNVDYSDYKLIAPPFDEPPRQRGCFFYGCIIAIVLSLLLLIAVVVLIFILYRLLGSFVDEYTATAPRELPKVVMPAEQFRPLKEREEAFRQAIKEGKPTEPLVLTADELNALIDDKPELKGKVHVAIDQDKLKGQVSLPLNDVPSFGLTRGRYLNGEAEFKVWLKDGTLFVTIDSFEVNGKRPSQEALVQFRGINWAQGANENPETSNLIAKLESIEIKEGKLIIMARDPTKAPADGKSEASPPNEDHEGTAGADPSKKAPAPSGGTAKPPDPLPDNVLAPPEPVTKP